MLQSSTAREIIQRSRTTEQRFCRKRVVEKREIAFPSGREAEYLRYLQRRVL